jgi:hypothetical protein
MPCRSHGAERRAILADPTGEAIGASLKGARFAILHPNDRCFGNNLIGRSGLYLGEVCWLGGWDFIARGCKRGTGTNEYSQC